MIFIYWKQFNPHKKVLPALYPLNPLCPHPVPDTALTSVSADAQQLPLGCVVTGF